MIMTSGFIFLRTMLISSVFGINRINTYQFCENSMVLLHLISAFIVICL